jgi:hypothetical protein
MVAITRYFNILLVNIHLYQVPDIWVKLGEVMGLAKRACLRLSIPSNHTSSTM